VSGFEVPVGEPSAVRASAGRLRQMAHDVDAAGHDLVGEQRGMAAVWRSDAGRAATSEVGVLGAQATGFGGRVAGGAAALDRYAAALEHAQGAARALAARDAEADAQARREAGRIPSLPAADQDDIYRREYATLRRPLDTAYRAALDDLDRAARTCRATLESAVPGYHRGMTPTQIALAARRASTVHLPTIWSADQTRQGRADATAVATALAAGRTPDPDLLDRIKTNALDETYSAAFATTLGAAGLAKLPGQVGRLDADDPTRRTLMTAFGAIVGRATNGTGPDLPTDQTDDLVARAGSTARSDPPHEARDYWSVLELVTYGRGAFAPATLARIAGTVYDNRGALHGAQQTANPDQHEISTAEKGRRLDDPMLAILGELAATPEAGRIFFDVKAADGELERMHNLMREYHAKPGGDEGIVVKAISEAAVRFAPYQRVGADGKRGGEIASWFLHYAAGDLRTDAALSPATRAAVTGVLVNYYEDLRETLLVDAGGDLGAVSGPREKDTGLPFEIGAKISKADASSLLAEIWPDPAMSRRLMGAAAVRAQAYLQVQNAGHPAPAVVNNAFGVYGADVGRLLHAAYGGQIGVDDTNSMMLSASKMFFDVGTAAVGGPADGAKAVIFGVAQEIGDGLFDFGNPHDRARSAYAAEITNLDQSARLTVAEMMLRTQAWVPGKGDPVWNWYDPNTKQLIIPPAGTKARGDFDFWLADHGGVPFGDAEQAFSDQLRKAATAI
jgi:uncharacterized protein YukE